MTQAAADSLLWIKGELDATLESARQGIERYLEDQDREGLQECLRCLRQTHGTLRMVEVQGGAMLAEEMESLVKNVTQGSLDDEEAALEALTRGLLQLPDYLERIAGGQEDVPLALLSLVNEMRAAQGRTQLSESAVFARDISQRQVSAKVARPGEASGDDAQALAQKLRGKFQKALLGWYRDDSKPKYLKALSKISEKLEDASETPPVFQLWWVVGGIFEALLDGGLEADVSLKQWVGRVDREIKRLAQEGEGAFREESPEDLIHNLLYYIGRSRSNGERVSSLRESFGLEQLLPEAEKVEAMERSLSGPNRELMDTVSSAVREDIARVKDALDIHVRLDGSDPADLQTQAASLKKVADTLGMLGLEELRERVSGEHAVLAEMGAGERQLEDGVLLDTASTLIEVEQALDREMQRASGEGGGSGEASGADEATDAVIRESIVNIARVKERIQDFVKSPDRKDLLEPIPQWVSQIRGGLGLLELDRAGEILEAAARYIRDRIFAAEQTPAEADLDRLADAVVSTEFFLETIQQGRGRPESMLDNAENCISELGYRPGALPAEDPAVQDAASQPDTDAAEPPPEESPAQGATEEAPAPSDDDGGEEIRLEGFELDEGEEASAEDTEEPATPVAADGETAATEPEDPPAPEPEAPEAGSAAKPVAGPSKKPVPKPEDIPPEIVEIFLEEADEELARFRDYFPRWRENPGDQDALVTVRRSFHTLKGSGRMVGAEFIGEFAWSFENMLNRVIDQTIDATPALVNLVGQGIDAVPELVEQLKGGPDPETDVVGLMEAADAFSRGETPEPVIAAGDGSPSEGSVATAPAQETAAADPVSKSIPSEETEAPEEATEGSPEPQPAMDPTLYDIFRRESERHLETVERVLRELESGDETAVSDELVRALHTLKGSAHTAGVREIPEFIGPLEHLGRAMQETGTSPEERHREVLREACEQTRRMIEELATPEGAQSAPEALLERISALREELPEPSGELDAAESSDTVFPGSAEEAEEASELPSLEGLDVGEEDSGLQAPDELGDAEESEPEDSESADSQAPAADESTSPSGGGRLEMPKAAAGLAAIPLEDLPDYDPELASVFLEEANELSESMDSALQQWEADGDDSALVQALQRDLHTLKGGARMSGITPMGDLSHEMETVLTKAVDGKLPISTEFIRLIQRCVDRAVKMVEQVGAGAPIADGSDLVDELQRFDARGGQVFDEEPQEPSAAPEPASQPAVDAAAEEPVAANEQAEEPEGGEGYEAVERHGERRGASRVQQEVVRVQADLLENLLNNAGEVSIYRSRVEQQLSNMDFHLNELDQTVERLRQQFRNLEIEIEAQVRYEWEKDAETDPEFDPLELDRYSQLQQFSRALQESVSDIVSLQGLLSNHSREAETLLIQQSRVNTDLQDGLMRTRMLPFSRHAQRLRRIVRQTADEEGKQVELRLIGAEGEMDRQVLERIIAPLEHLLRNAVIHGLEAPEERQQQDKPESGLIAIELHREGSEVVIEVMDDGRGLNLQKIREKAEQRGLVRPGSELSETEVMQLILEPGFSTADKVTQSAGRGVGMDVVHSEIKQLGGNLHMTSSQEVGSRFTIRLPYTLAITQALMVELGEDLYAIPLPSIEGIVRVPTEEAQQLLNEEDARYSYGGRYYQVQHLGAQLGVSRPHLPEDTASVPMLLVRVGDYSAALITEGMRGSREVVVKSVGPQIANIRGISGATIMGDGSIVLILDVGGIVRGGQRASAELDLAETHVEEETAAETTPTVMVVDDSITVRRVTQRLLERHNLEVVTAKDGVDALSTLQEVMPDIMLLDIEMPRMDGYELATHMRNDSRLKGIPIIMITSRTGEKHRNRAYEIGVDRYLGKPYQETELLEHIRALAGDFDPAHSRTQSE